MDEQEWLAGGTVAGMLHNLERYRPGAVNARKQRLFGCACCRRIWDQLPDADHRRAVEVAERFADGLASAAEMAQARLAVLQTVHLAAVMGRSDAISWAVLRTAGEACFPSIWVSVAADAVANPRARYAEERQQAALVRDIFANPFRRAAVDPTWLTWDAGALPQLARAIYEDRRFTDLPVLADALEEAGCTDAEVLGHCRGPGPHARGCWLLDLLLGRA